MKIGGWEGTHITTEDLYLTYQNEEKRQKTFETLKEYIPSVKIEGERIVLPPPLELKEEIAMIQEPDNPEEFYLEKTCSIVIPGLTESLFKVENISGSL